jgi:flagellar motor switch protein FliN
MTQHHFLRISKLEIEIEDKKMTQETTLKEALNATNDTTNSASNLEFDELHNEKSIPQDFAVTSPSMRGDMNMVMDIPVVITVELGRAKLPIKQILQLAQGSVIELDALAGEPMDVYVNGCLIAQGEVVVMGEKFGIRLTDIVTPSERIRRMSRK